MVCLSHVGMITNLLQKAQVNVIDKLDCQQAYGAELTNSMMCAGSMEGDKDTCLVSFCSIFFFFILKSSEFYSSKKWGAAHCSLCWRNLNNFFLKHDCTYPMILNALKVFFSHLKHPPCLLSWLRNPAKCNPTISLSFQQTSVNVIPSIKTPLNAVVLSLSTGRLRGPSGVPWTPGPVVSGWGDQLWWTWLPGSLHASHCCQRMDIYIPPFLRIQSRNILHHHSHKWRAVVSLSWKECMKLKRTILPTGSYCTVKIFIFGIY